MKLRLRAHALPLALLIAGAISLFARAQRLEDRPVVPASPAAREPADAPRISREKITVQVHLSASGGDVTVEARDSGDTATRDALGVYARVLRERAAGGDFSLLDPFFPAGNEGTSSRLQDKPGVTPIVESIAAGFRFSLVAADQDSRTRIHNFLHSAGGTEKTVDPADRVRNHPGNNLGWDARRDPNLDK